MTAQPSSDLAIDVLQVCRDGIELFVAIELSVNGVAFNDYLRFVYEYAEANGNTDYSASGGEPNPFAHLPETFAEYVRRMRQQEQKQAPTARPLSSQRTPHILAVSPPPPRTDGSNWRDAIAGTPEVESFKVVEWSDIPIMPLRGPGEDERIVIDQRLDVPPDRQSIPFPGVAVLDPAGCLSGPYPQPEGDVDVDYVRERCTFKWQGGELEAGSEVAISFDAFDSERLSVEYVAVVGDCRLA
jgi:hypothetical protein